MLTDDEIDEIRFRIPTKAVTQRDYEVARAVEQAAYERAAQECEKRAGPIEIYNRAYPNFMDCAAAIRALMAQEQPK